ncbi:HD-GYP domain-containing protein [Malonomonas rubra]|uniref:HD-GYP domain-containing protein n=1 Tax=Malonomonas rubra TaxID=57040 RepID=UPI0026F334C3|nr:HD domain-containing phosphohydrolase [Malonomonas rubra]
MIELYRDDFFAEIHQRGRLQERLARAHQFFDQCCPGLDRIGIALCDDSLEKVKTFLASPAEGNPLTNYHISLCDAESLSKTAISGQVRVVNDLEMFIRGKGDHTHKIWDLGMRSSYTLPIFEQRQLRGFVFFNSRRTNYFQDESLNQMALFGHFLVQMVLNHQETLRTLVASLRITGKMMHYKDPETSSHLERMAHFSQLIAQEMVAQGEIFLDDEEIDHLFRFAPLHDIGKLGIPDEILLKPGKLDAQEWKVMRTHSGIGRAIVDQLINEFGFSTMPDIEILRHITELHHEKIDGSGYPLGLEGDQVPIAARIISVSDIFDALTSTRPYKQAWSNQAAFAELEEMVHRNQLDPLSVAALQRRRADVEQIQQVFYEQS